MLKLTALVLSVAPLVLGAPDPRWRAILSPVGGSKVGGGVTVEAKGPESTRFTVAIRGAPVNSTLSWHMHGGTCAAVGAVIGAPSMYPALKSGPGGTAEAAVTLSVAPPGSGEFVVQVHGPSGGPLACGELKLLEGEKP